MNGSIVIHADTLRAERTNHTVNLLRDEPYLHVILDGDSPLYFPRILDAIDRSPSIRMLGLTDSTMMSREDAASFARIATRMTEVHISECVFTDEVCGIIANAIRATSALKHLNLSDVVPTHALRFAGAMRETLETLYLSDMAFGAESAHAFALAFGCLKHLHLQNIRGCEHMVTAIAGATEMRTLVLGDVSLRAPDTLVLCQALGHLTRLRLNRSRLDSASLCTALSQSRTMRHLTLCYCWLNMAEVMKCVGGLEELEIYNADLGGGACATLIRAISQSTTLRNVDVNLCALGDDRQIALANAVGANGRIKEFKLLDGNLSDDLLYALASAVMKSPDLEFLSVAGREDFGPEALGVLAKAIATRWRITYVKIAYRVPEIIERALERSKQNAKLLAFCGGLVGPRTPLCKFLARDGDNAVLHRVLGFLGDTT
jgi:hypothetical protein